MEAGGTTRHRRRIPTAVDGHTAPPGRSSPSDTGANASTIVAVKVCVKQETSRTLWEPLHHSQQTASHMFLFLPHKVPMSPEYCLGATGRTRQTRFPQMLGEPSSTPSPREPCDGHTQSLAVGRS